MISYSGAEVYPGKPFYLPLYDIGWSLARSGRFGNHTEVWYSVLPHTYTVAELVRPEYRVHALLHDAAEAIIGDRVKTWKDEATEALELEAITQIYEGLGLEWNPREWGEEVLAADLTARAAEAEMCGHPRPDLFPQAPKETHDLARSLTEGHMFSYNPIKCILETHALAAEYEKRVMEAIASVLV